MRIPVFLCLLLVAYAARAECTGSVEERLRCQAPFIKTFLGDWVKSWARGDIDAYLSHYVGGRSPRPDMDFASWEKSRRDRVHPDNSVEIDLKLESIGLEDSGLYDVVFLQFYRSETYQDQVRKRLFLLPDHDGFRIFREEVIP